MSIATALALTLASCASVDRRVEIIHSDSGLKGSNIYTLAVLPPTLPQYLDGWVEAEKLTAEIWQIFHTELQGEVMLLVADPQRVWSEVLNRISRAEEWIFNGNREVALKVAQSLKADGFVVLAVEEWKEGGLDAASVRIRCTLVRTADDNTLLDMREIAVAHSEQGAASTRDLALQAARSVSRKLLKAMRTGQPAKALNISPRTAAGAGLISAGMISGFGALHMHNLAEQSYDRYREVDNAVELEKFRDMTQQYDDLSMLLALGSAGLIGTGISLIFTDGSSYALQMTPCVAPGENGVVLLSIRFGF